MAIRLLEIMTLNGLKTVNLFQTIQIKPYGEDQTLFEMVNGDKIFSNKSYKETRKLIFRKEVSDEES